MTKFSTITIQNKRNEGTNVLNTFQLTIEPTKSPLFTFYKNKTNSSCFSFFSSKEKYKKLDLYQQFIDSFTTGKQRYVASTFLEKHHILPLHAGGDNSSKNLISLSIRDTKITL